MKILIHIVRYEEDNFDGYFPHRKGDVANIKTTGTTEPCCDRMRQAMDDGFVDFGDSDFCNTTAKMTIANRVCYPSGTVTDFMEIDYCPFCGEEINVEVDA